jgi:hypothetical protein
VPTAAPRGHHPYREITCCLLQQTTIKTACNRARKSTLHATPGVESWSVFQACGVHRRPSRSPLSLVFSVCTVCNCLIFLKWHGRGQGFESLQVHQPTHDSPVIPNKSIRARFTPGPRQTRIYPASRECHAIKKKCRPHRPHRLG